MYIHEALQDQQQIFCMFFLMYHVKHQLKVVDMNLLHVVLDMELVDMKTMDMMLLCMKLLDMKLLDMRLNMMLLDKNIVDL